MVTHDSFDTEWARTVTQNLGTTLSNYSSPGNQLLANISIIPLTYGQQRITRNISDPYQDVVLGRRFNAPEQQAEKRVQSLDFVSLSKRVMIDALDYAADPRNAAIHIADSMNIMRDGLEKQFIEGSATPLLQYGLADAPGGTAGTIIRPEDAGVQATSGDWSVITNMQEDITEGIGMLLDKGFYGPPMLLAPSITMPMFAHVQTSTAVPVATWIQSALGLPIVFSPFVDADATRDVFDCYLIDRSKVHIGVSDLKLDAYYSNLDHAYYWDMETYTVPLFDPIYDETEWIKGKVSLLARDWSD